MKGEISMRAVIQRVERASVEVGGNTVGSIGKGILLLLGVGTEDTEKDLRWMLNKVPNLRIFEDDEGKMNRSLVDSNGGILVISQFTLYGDCRRGRRPSFSDAAAPDAAKRMYEEFCDLLSAENPALEVERGIFQAEMKVDLLNDGPVTLLLDSKGNF